MAASCITTSNISTNGDGLTPMSGFAKRMCAVLEMGKNSVRPSIIEIMMD